MRIAIGRVIDGKIVVDGDPIEDGTTVTILAPESDESFNLAPEQKAELLAAIREADEGLGRDAWEFLRELGRKT